MKSNINGKPATVIIAMFMVLSFFGAGISSTGCLGIWETMDNMVVGASVSVDEKGDFVVDGAVTSASVKALGYVAGAAEVDAAFNAVSEANADAGVDCSWYDSIRYNRTNSRIVDYERAAGTYTNYYGKDNWYSWGEPSVQSVVTDEYSSAVASVNSLTASDVNWDSIGLNALGQTSPTFSLQSGLMKTFDLSGGMSTDFGDITQFSSLFGIQQFVWKMDNIVGKNWKSDDAFIYVRPDNIDIPDDIEGLNSSEIPRSDIEVNIRIDDGIKSRSVSAGAFIYADTYFVPKADGTVEYYVYVLTDAMRELTHIGDEMVVDVDLCMIGIKVPKWADISDTVGGYTTGNDNKLTTSVKDALDDIKINSDLILYNLSSSFTDFAAGIVSGIQDSVGSVNTPMGLEFFTSGLIGGIKESLGNGLGVLQGEIRAAKYVNGIIVMKSIASKDARAKAFLNSLDSDNVYFKYKSSNLINQETQHTYALGSTTTQAEITGERAAQITQYNKWGVVNRFPNNDDLFSLKVVQTAGNANSVWSTTGTDNTKFDIWIDYINAYMSNIISSYNSNLDILKSNVDLDFVLEGARVQYFSGNVTHVKVESVTDKAVSMIATMKDDLTAGLTGQYNALWNSYNETTNEFNETLNGMTAEFAVQYASIYSALNLTLGTVRGQAEEIWNMTQDIELLNLNISNLQSVIASLSADLFNQTKLTQFYYEQYNRSQDMLSSLIMDLDKYGFSTGWSAENNIWLFNVDFEKFVNNFNIIRDMNIAPASYVFTDNLIDGQFYIPFKIDVTNDDMLNDTYVEFFAKTLTVTTYSSIGTVNCSYDDGNIYSVPIDALDTGTYDIKAVATFTNSTVTPLDDVVFETVPEFGFGENVQFSDKSLEHLLMISEGYNPMFIDVDTVNVVFKLSLYDEDDKMYLPPVSFIGGNLRTAAISKATSTSVKWSVNYIREHTYVGTITILDMEGTVIEEVEIPAFTLNEAAYAESSRRSDTLSIADFEEGTEFAAFGKWDE